MRRTTTTHPARQALAHATGRRDRLALPASALAETLVAPTRRGPEAVTTAESFLAALPAEILPLDHPTARAAAALRAHHGARLKLPDALVVATAHVHDAETLLTTERAWPTRRALGLRGDLVVLCGGESAPTLHGLRDDIGRRAPDAATVQDHGSP